MNDLMHKFLEWMRVTNHSPATVSNTELYLGYFIRWAEDRGVTKATEVTKQVLERYRRFLFNYRKRNGDPISFSTQHSRLVPIRAWFKWLARQNYVLYNAASELELPKLASRLPKHILTASEAEQVIAQATNVRDRAILETLYSTGMRRMELVGLKVYDLDADRGTVMIRQGKGRKDRMIPIGERALAWIDKYQRELRPALVIDGSSVLFLSNRGEPFTPNQLTHLVRDYVSAAEIGKQGSCHLFRHTCATLMLENGADVRFIQAMLGHAKLDTTMIYTAVSIRKLKEIHTATHPARAKRPAKPEDS
jgi:integrase/recombinase XerD